MNGTDLRDSIHEVELPFAVAEGNPDIAGSYAGVRAEVLHSDHLLGSAVGIYQGKYLEEESAPNRVALFICECGEIGCWPLIATITVTDGTVTWSDFRQPHRGEWHYDHLNPFTFTRAAYDAALEDVRALEQSAESLS